MQKLVEKLGLSEGAASAALWVILSVVLLAVVALLALWLVRTLRPSLNMNGANRGGRPQRLAITDAFPLDREGRKLVIVRRDNTEHLLLIGGPNDVLVEGNITRYDRASRGGQARTNEYEQDEAPMAVAPSAPLAPTMMPTPVVHSPAMSAPVMPAPMMTPPMAPVAVAPPVVAPPPAPVTVAPPVVSPPVVSPAPRREPVAPPVVQQAAPAPASSAPPVLTLETLLADATPVKAEPPKAEPPKTEAPKVEAQPAPAPVEPPPAPVTPPPRPPAMSEMARRLNEALQKPVTGTLRPPFNRSIPPAPPTAGPSASPTPPVTPVAPPAEPPPTPEVKSAAPAPEPVAKADMDLLEEEMARLLGRPAQPKKPDIS